MDSSTFDDVFTEMWVESMIRTWNEKKAFHAKLAGAGSVVFRCQADGEERACHIRWDDRGWLDRVEGTPHTFQEFVAPMDQWRKLFAGEISNASAVISGKIKFNGSPLFLFKFGPAFDSFIKIAQMIEARK